MATEQKGERKKEAEMAKRTEAQSLTGLTERFAEFVTSLRFDDLPAGVVTKAKLILRDGIGNQIAASAISEPGGRVVELYTEWGGKPEATVVGYGVKIPAPLAALCNGALGHGVELDDAHGSGLLKAGSVLIPAAFATAETAAVTGQQLLAGLVAGYEISVRLAKAINPGHRQRGYHTTSTVGTIGAAAVAAKLLGGDAEEIASAIGLAAMNSAGIQSYLDFPCMAKPLGPGRAAFNGVLAGTLAVRGFTGPKTALESGEGFLHAMTDSVRESDLLDGLGEHFTIMEVGFKPHAACRYAHGPIDLAQQFHRVDGIRSGDVETLEIRASQLAVRQASKPDCPVLGTAMGSTEFGVALALARGSNGLKDYWDGFGDQDVHALAKRIRMQPEPEFGVGGRQSIIDLKTRDGRILTRRQEEPRGEPSNPLTPDELAAKYFSTATLVVDRAQAERVAEVVMNLENEAEAGIVPGLAVVGSGKPGLRVA